MVKSIFNNKQQFKTSVIYAIIFAVVLLDQITKFTIKSVMYLYDSIEIIGDFFKLTYIENPGMAFGIQIESKILFAILSFAAAIIVLVYLIRLRNEQFLFRLSLSLILGGAIGNLIDRVLYGKVVDFLDVEFFDISLPSFKFLFINFPGYEMTRWPVFNIADSAVTCGMILITWIVLFQKPSVNQEATP